MQQKTKASIEFITNKQIKNCGARNATLILTGRSVIGHNKLTSNYIYFNYGITECNPPRAELNDM